MFSKASAVAARTAPLSAEEYPGVYRPNLTTEDQAAMRAEEDQATADADQLTTAQETVLASLTAEGQSISQIATATRLPRHHVAYLLCNLWDRGIAASTLGLWVRL